MNWQIVTPGVVNRYSLGDKYLCLSISQKLVISMLYLDIRVLF